MPPHAAAATAVPTGPHRPRVRGVLVAGALAAALGLGPAIAWDLTTQPPRAEPRSAWPRASPWKEAGVQMKEGARAMVRVYLPPAASSSSQSVGAPAAASGAPTAMATASTPTRVWSPLTY